MSAAIASPPNFGAAGGVGAGEPPRFLSPLSGGGSIPEGEPVRFEVRVGCSSDVNITWFKDGSPLSAGSRFNTAFDRGYACLDIIYTFPEDSGAYTCQASNPLGAVATDPVVVQVIAEDEPSQAELEATLASLDVCGDARARETSRLLDDEREQRMRPTAAPIFSKQPVVSAMEVVEGEPWRVETQLSTVSDNSLQVEWMKDGKCLGTGSRFNTTVDRGLLTMQIEYCFPEDSGSYTCIAKNAIGQTESNSVNLVCHAEAKIVTNSILDEESMANLKNLEEPGAEYNTCAIDMPDNVPPRFTATVTPPSYDVTEDTHVTFSVPVEVGNGNNMKLEWYRDGEVVRYSSRITGSIELGIASIVIRYSQPSDSGIYTCCVSTEFGTAESEKARLDCRETLSIDGASQLPGDKNKGMQAIDKLEADLNASKQRAEPEEVHFGPPSFTVQPNEVGTIAEGDPANFEAHIQPVADATVCVDWYKDEKQLTSGTRFRADYERGVAILQILHCIPEDSGVYWCKVRNIDGQADSKKINLEVTASESVITFSNIMQGADGEKLIKTIERTGDEYDTASRYIEPEEPDSPPNFDVPPQAAVVIQNQPVRFLVRIAGKPSPEVTWFLNDEPIQQDSMTKFYADGAINYLEMGRCAAPVGTNKIRVVATNGLGEKSAETALTVSSAEEIHADLKHVTPENPFKKMFGLKKVERTPELTKAMQRAKPTAESIIKMERGTEIKARTFRSPEVMEAEQMYDKMALGLRKSEINRPNMGNEGN